MLVEIPGMHHMRIKFGERGDALAPALPEHLAFDDGTGSCRKVPPWSCSWLFRAERPCHQGGDRFVDIHCAVEHGGGTVVIGISTFARPPFRRAPTR